MIKRYRDCDIPNLLIFTTVQLNYTSSFLLKYLNRDLCEEMQYVYRVVRKDSDAYAITDDFMIERINVEIDNGLISNCHIG